MIADFIHVSVRDVKMADRLKQDLDIQDDEMEVLHIWIEGPISPSIEGFFQDVKADVKVDDLQDPDLAGTVALLSDLIWDNIPDRFKS